MPRAWDASFLHEHLEEALDGAEQYILSAPLEILGKLAVSADGIPVELTQADQPEIILRAATEEPEVMPQPSAGLRSEEHTSELQSLMRISYAVFCLTKKKQIFNP